MKSKVSTQNRKLNTKPVRIRSSERSWLSFILPLSAISYGLYHAIHLRWICDDAFITMRYVKNFVDGNGLVYNIGEKVEGYTHFLWLLLLAAAKVIGFDPVDASIWVGIVAFASTVIMLISISYREYQKRVSEFWIPIAAVFFACNYDVAEWASGGLETSFYSFLIFLSFYTWFYSKFRNDLRSILTGLGLALISLTRPDGVLFTITGASLLVAQGIARNLSLKLAARTVVLLLLPSAVIGIPYLLWKYSYYGDILPLTYYAKSADENYYSQGFFYIWLFLRVHLVLTITLGFAIAVLLWSAIRSSAWTKSFERGSPIVAAITATAMYLFFFVARVGGDFMFARFIIPIVPFLCFLVEAAAGRLNVRSIKLHWAVLLIIGLIVYLDDHIQTTPYFWMNENGTRSEDWNTVVVDGKTNWISDERWFYYQHLVLKDVPRGTMDMYSDIGRYLEPFFHGLPVTVEISGAMNMIAYYANFATCINEFGLTDYHIAHSRITDRGHIGHEKTASEDYLISRHVDFQLKKVTSILPTPNMTEIAFEIPDQGIWQLGRVVTYNRMLMDSLLGRFQAAGNQTKIPLYEYIIPEYLKNSLRDRPLDLLKDDYAGFRRFYFDRYPDRSMQRQFEERIADLEKDSVTKALRQTYH